MSTPDMPRKVNFGCGYDKRDGYVNVDVDPACNPDLLLINNDFAPLPRYHFDEVLALDVLEHVPRLETQAIVLEWADLLSDQGRLIVKTSSITGVAERLEHTDSFRQQFGWTQCLFGSQAHGGDFHFTGFTEMTLTVQLLAAGFQVDRMWLTDHWLLHAEATKVWTWASIIHDNVDRSDREFVNILYRTALDRDPEPNVLDQHVIALTEGATDRRALARSILASVERLFVVAERHEFEPAPPAITAARVARRIPEPLKPALRWTRSTARTASSQTRRAVGSLKRRRLHT